MADYDCHTFVDKKMGGASMHIDSEKDGKENNWTPFTPHNQFHSLKALG